MNPKQFVSSPEPSREAPTPTLESPITSLKVTEAKIWAASVPAETGPQDFNERMADILDQLNLPSCSTCGSVMKPSYTCSECGQSTLLIFVQFLFALGDEFGMEEYNRRISPIARRFT